MRIRSRILTKVAAFCAVATFKFLFATCRKKFIGQVPMARLEASGVDPNSERFVLCVWHDALLLPTFGVPRHLRKQACCLVSRHNDGSYLAEAMAWLNYTTVRGSSNRGGFDALRQLLNDTAGKHIIFAPDGPSGPRRKLKQGAVFTAAQTGRRLLPGAFVAERGWRIRVSWTDLLIPKPFTTIYLVTGEPITIPPDLSREELQRYVERAQNAMDQLDDVAERICAGPPPEPVVTEQKRVA